MTKRRKEYNAAFFAGREEGIATGKALGKREAEEALKQRETDLRLRVRALHGACLLAKTLVEQLGLAGVPQWAETRSREIV